MTLPPDWRSRIPWVFLVLAAVALTVQLQPGWRAAWLYDRAAVMEGEWWRLWSGHWVHFGWPHFVADAGLFLILGVLLERPHRRMVFAALAFMPPGIGLVLLSLDPTMAHYGGLSALNLGLLLFLALQGWQRNWRDWFWPAVLVIYVGEIVFEILTGGTGGGMIRFDDPNVRVATSAQMAGAADARGVWGWGGWRPR
ncbi:MAG: rhombosortase [Cephaloticoccus sp.]